MFDKRVSTNAEGIAWPEVEDRSISSFYSFDLLLFDEVYLNTDRFLSRVS